MKIPKRPKPGRNIFNEPLPPTKLEQHEHAVAKRAVDALRLCMERPACAR